MKKKLLSLALVLAMALTLLPTAVFAQEDAACAGDTAAANHTREAGGKLGEAIPAVAATCTTPGNPKYWTCSECGWHLEEKEDGTLADPVKETPSSAALGHDFAATYTDDGNGKHSKHCSRCDAKQDVLVHVSDTRATGEYFDENYHKITCAGCGAKFNDAHKSGDGTSCTQCIFPSGSDAPAAPTFDPKSGSKLVAGDTVAITCATDGAEIRYTTDGTAPTATSTLYSDSNKPTVTATAKTIKAIAIKDGKSSAVVTATYTIKEEGGNTPDNPTPAAPSFSFYGYDPHGQNAIWKCSVDNPTFTLTLDGVSVSSKNVKVDSDDDGTPIYIYKIEQTGDKQILEVVCNGDAENKIQIPIPAKVDSGDVADAIDEAAGSVTASTSAGEVKDIIAGAMDTLGAEDPTAAAPAETLTDSAIVNALEKINEKRKVTVQVTGDRSSSVTDAMKQWIAASAEPSTKVTITQKSTSNPKTADIPQDYRKNKISTISVEVKFGNEVQTEFGMTFPVVLPLPSGFSTNPANLRVLHYHDGSDAPIVRIPVKDGGSLVVFVNKLSDFAIVDTSSGSSSGGSSGGGGSSSGSSVSGALSGVSKPAAKPSTPAAPAAPAAPSAPAGIFTDVPAAHTFASQIKWALDNGVMGGYADGSFRPDNNTNRQQLWMVLGRLAGANPADMAAAREWAVGAGISDGSSAEGAMSRQQLVTMLYRFAQSQGKAVSGAADLSAYSDSAAVASYAQEALAWAVGNGIVTGTSDGRLNPEGAASRAHFAAFLYRFSNAA